MQPLGMGVVVDVAAEAKLGLNKCPLLLQNTSSRLNVLKKLSALAFSNGVRRATMSIRTLVASNFAT